MNITFQTMNIFPLCYYKVLNSTAIILIFCTGKSDKITTSPVLSGHSRDNIHLPIHKLGGGVEVTLSNENQILSGQKSKTTVELSWQWSK